MTREIWGAVLALGAAVTIVFAVAGCGSRDEPSLTEGKALFVQGCGSCHTLARAGTGGKAGPNLDQAFDTAIQDGFTRDTVKGVVEHQILYPIKKGVMPAKIFTGKQAKDVAAYVAYATDRKGEDGGALAQAGLAGATSGEQIFTAAGCAGCHTLGKAGATGKIGPSLNDLPTEAGDIEPGTSAEDYVRQSIVDPSAFVVQGFKDGVMPPYKGKLTDKQVDALVKYLLDQ